MIARSWAQAKSNEIDLTIFRLMTEVEELCGHDLGRSQIAKDHQIVLSLLRQSRAMVRWHMHEADRKDTQ